MQFKRTNFHLGGNSDGHAIPDPYSSLSNKRVSYRGLGKGNPEFVCRSCRVGMNMAIGYEKGIEDIW